MTTAELHVAVNTRLQQVGAHVNDDFLLDEMDYYLSAAQRNIVIDRVQQAGGDIAKIPVSDLRPLISEYLLLPLLDASDFPLAIANEYYCPWPEDFLQWMSGETGLTRTADPVIVTKEYVGNIAITEDQVINYRVTTEHSPHIRNPRVVTREDYLHVFCDVDTTLIDQTIQYIRYPNNIVLDESDDFLNQDSELPEHLHDEIVERALQTILRDLNASPEE